MHSSLQDSGNGSGSIVWCGHDMVDKKSSIRVLSLTIRDCLKILAHLFRVTGIRESSGNFSGLCDSAMDGQSAAAGFYGECCCSCSWWKD
ncbi:hypothetical protein CEXT_270281 [Caerostris extrusa]|uniref:Uncharacterized protein n=1 Tax=Caerostris extrusa TaxID=172846 RepID=A0AAV4TJN8_CAEEX|nr:hypothetical protein CEXT_270281 [Caerostris extrusa]